MKEGDRVKLGSKELHYIRTVLRLKKGDRLILFGGAGFEYEAVLREFTTQNVTLEIIRKKKSKADALIRVTLAQALPKGNKMDFIIRKATELGVNRIIPFKAPRSVPRPSEERIPLRLSRWQRIAIDASRKCGRGDVPEITDVVTFNEVLQWPGDEFLKMVLWEEESTTGIKEVLRDEKHRRRVDFLIVVGPEGGFSKGEIETALRAGFLSVSLGGLVFPVETAVLAILFILQYEKGAFDVAAKKD